MPVPDNMFQRYILPALIGLAASASMGAFTLVWNLDKKVALIESRQWVGREEFAMVKAELIAAREDISRLREWMKSHSQRSGQEAYPAAAPVAVPPPGYEEWLRRQNPPVSAEAARPPQ